MAEGIVLRPGDSKLFDPRVQTDAAGRDRRSRVVAALLALACCLPACGPDAPSEDPGPQCYRLATDFRPEDVHRRIAAALEAWSDVTPDAPDMTCEAAADGRGSWLARRIQPDDWTETQLPGLWSTPFVLMSAGAPLDGGDAVRLLRDGQPLDFLFEEGARMAWRAAVQRSETTPDTFFQRGEQLYVASPERPPELEHGIYMTHGHVVDGRWRFQHNRFAGDGVAVFPGTVEEVAVDAEEPLVLHLATAAQPSLVALDEETARFRFTVHRLGPDGGEQLLLDHEQGGGRLGSLSWHALPVSPGAGSLRFAVEGPPALAAFLAPVLSPAPPAPPVADGTTGEGAEPTSDDSNGEAAADAAELAARRVALRATDPRPDVVLFLADTFRADNMALYGGEPGFTPNLDAFAEGCVRFREAWSPATWTLPSHVSMFTALYPSQHYATSKDFAVGPNLLTMAEAFTAAGYRTGAITDAGVVTHRTGLAQGFEVWDERAFDMTDTIDRTRAFLEAGDGRPTFLFVQSYAVHTPYQVSKETRQSHGDRLDLQGGTSPELELQLAASRKGREPGTRIRPDDEAGLQALRQYHDLYRGGVVDLDRAFAELLGVLDDNGLRDGVLVVTSDHGEAFDEHGELGHGTGVWDEEVRVPLLVRAPDLEPRDVTLSASLVDLPRTLTALADVPAGERWIGRDLFAARSDAPVFAFLASRRVVDPNRVALIQGGRKLITLAESELELGVLREAYDLRADPAELDNLAPDGADWIAALEARLQPVLSRLLRPVEAPQRRVLSSREAEALRAMGYADF